MRVAVIGAGAAGIAATKVCLEEGIEPVCFERTSHFGGVWHLSDEPRPDPTGPAATYEGMHTLVSKEMMAFSDFSFPKELPPFIKVSDMHNYYEAYVQRFQLLKYMHFNTDVIAVEQTDDYPITGRWRVTIRGAIGEERTEMFDAVMVCTGVNSAGFMPTYPGLDGFPGEVIHSCQFKSGRDYHGKTLLVVGSSLSAGDIAIISSAHARKTYISMRHGTWISSRWQGNEPLVSSMSIRATQLFPARLAGFLAKPQLESLLDYTGLGLRSQKEPGMTPGMINDELAPKIRNGDVRVRSGIEKFDGSKVVFTDGTTVDDIDAVIFATGYELKFPFFKKDLIQDGYTDVRLYRLMFPPHLSHPTLAFIGFIVPASGQNIINELQMRYAISLLKKKTQLPPVREMEEEISNKKDALYQAMGNHYPQVLDAVQYKDNLARDIGALPSMARLLFTDPKLFYHFYFGPAYPPCYRLVGPGANPDARESFLRSRENLLHGITLTTVRKDAAEDIKMQQRRGRDFCLLSFGVLLLSLFVLNMLIS